MDIDFSKLKFEFSWSTAVIVVGLLTSTITLVLQNKGLSSNVKDLKTEVNSLTSTISTLKGSQDITNNAINQFMMNPPGELKYRIEALEKKLNISNNQPTITAVFRDTLPSQ